MANANLQAGSAQILKTIVDAKGDIIAATAADAVAKLTVGANDTVLMAASGEATGLKWSGSPIAVDTVWDAKGDLVVGTGANTAAKLTAGANDFVLTAASGEATGLKWAAAAGGDVATDAIFDAKGDLAVGTGADTAAKLTVGAANTFPMADAGETTGLKWGLAPYHLCQGRLTLTTATPVTTADVSAAATLYFAPYQGNAVGLFDGTYWDILAFAELSLNISGYTASKPYDIWIYNNSGTPTLDSTVWTNATTRATALTTQDGILVKTGATTRRYLGTIYINSSGGQTDDSVTKRFVWNYYNQKERSLYKSDATSHSYTTTAFRSWNNDAALRVEFMTGVSESPLWVSAMGELFCTSGLVYVGVALDATNTITGELYGSNALTNRMKTGGSHAQFSGVGYHFLQLTQYGSTGGEFQSATVGGYILG